MLKIFSVVFAFIMGASAFAASCGDSSAQMNSLRDFAEQCIQAQVTVSGFEKADFSNMNSTGSPVSTLGNEPILSLVAAQVGGSSYSVIGECDSSTGEVVMLSLSAQFVPALKSLSGNDNSTMIGVGLLGTTRSLESCGLRSVIKPRFVESL